jgi:glyoxylase-like metal-dependent hydrolase (beta-lactamase superfamily II)
LIGNGPTKQAAVIDPANNPKKVMSRVKHYGLRVAYLFNTHGHFDHANGNEAVLAQENAELITGKNGRDGGEYPMGDVTLKVIHTPGHTTDSICILASEPGHVSKLITGDTLFVGKVGGTGYGEDARAEYDSLHDKLMILPDEVEVWPGHDYGVAPSSSIGHEKKTNPFILRDSFDSFVELKKNWLAYKAEHGID